MKNVFVKRTASIICILTLMMAILPSAAFAESDITKTGDEYTRALPIITDMVHDNPGGNPYVTQYDDCEFLSLRGLTGKVFFLSEAAQLAVDFQEYDPQVFPKDSISYKWVQGKKAELHEKYGEAKANDLKVYFMMDFISLPSSMKTLYGDAIMTNGKIDINKPKTQEIMEEMMDEIFKEFPEVDGFYLRYGESYVGYYSNYHFGNNPIGVSGTKANDHATLLEFFRDKVCEKHNKEVIYRTWSTEVGANSFTTSKSLYLQITDQVAPHDNLYIAIKHTAGDFWRNYTFNETIGIGKHKQIIEVQCSREYEGKGAYPNYIAGSVINGFEEYKWQMADGTNKCLRDVVNCENSIVEGIWTWSRGGGWSGPYTNGKENPDGDELWSDLNAYVLHQWAQDTSVKDIVLVKKYALEVLGMSNDDANAFVRLAELSALGVCYGIGTNSAGTWDSKWTRDNNPIAGTFEGNVSAACSNRDSNGNYIKLDERRRAAEIWNEIAAIAESFDDSVAKKEYIVVTSTYGKILYNIFERMYTAGVLYTDMTKNGAPVAHELMQAKSDYDALWDKFKALDKLYPCCPTLYDNAACNKIMNKYVCSISCRQGLKGRTGTKGAINVSLTGLNSPLVYTSVDSAVATVSSSGEVTAIAQGTTLVIAETADKQLRVASLIKIGTEGEGELKSFAYSGTDILDVADRLLAFDTSVYTFATAQKLALAMSAYQHNRNEETAQAVIDRWKELAPKSAATTKDTSLISLNKPAKASTVLRDEAQFAAAKVTDGDNAIPDGAENAGSRWNDGNNAGKDAWVYVDLGNVSKIDRIKLYWNYNNCPAKYYIQVSNDAQAWTDVATVTEDNLSSVPAPTHAVDNLNVEARYVRMFVKGSERSSGGGAWVSLVELEVYGEAGESTTPADTDARISAPAVQLRADGNKIRALAAVDGLGYECFGFAVRITTASETIESMILSQGIYTCVKTPSGDVTAQRLGIDSGYIGVLEIADTVSDAVLEIMPCAKRSDASFEYGKARTFTVIGGVVTAE